MSDRNRLWVLLLVVGIFVSGCAKKSSEQTNIASTGFDSATATPATTAEELSQLPAASGTASQTPAVEALPVEASPVTQASPTTSAAPVMDAAASGKLLTHEQEIQTALKNAGFYNGKIDGKLGPASKRAIMAFQKQSGLKADGKVGPKTWIALSAHLNNASAMPAATAPATEAPAGNQ